MKRHNKIFPLFFLSIFSMFILHQVLPHVHHEHEGSDGHIAGQYHSHEKDHHHDNEGFDDNFDFLGFLLGYHIHSVHAENTPTIKGAAKQLISVNDVPLSVLPAPQVYTVEITEVEKSGLSQRRPEFFYYIYLSGSLLRGPPFLS